MLIQSGSRAEISLTVSSTRTALHAPTLCRYFAFALSYCLAGATIDYQYDFLARRLFMLILQLDFSVVGSWADGLNTMVDTAYELYHMSQIDDAMGCLLRPPPPPPRPPRFVRLCGCSFFRPDQACRSASEAASFMKSIILACTMGSGRRLHGLVATPWPTNTRKSSMETRITDGS